jgi:hydroxymethylpyrimidine pyrophosphatase-like HAD family hydrolase
MNYSKLILAVDLDGTLLHPEPESIAVWGRTRYQYMSRVAAQRLAEISQVFPIAIATARHAQTVKSLVEQLPEVNFCGFVCENGLVYRHSLTDLSAPRQDWSAIVQRVSEWDQIQGYEQCLGLIPPPEVDRPQEVLEHALLQEEKVGHVYVDGRKIFVYPALPDKARGLKALGYSSFISAGNDLNDLEMLRDAHYVLTLSSAHLEVRNLVTLKQGYCAQFGSHAGTEDWLSHVLSKSHELLI